MDDNSVMKLIPIAKRLSLGVAAILTLCVFCLVGRGYSESEPSSTATSPTITAAADDAKLLKSLQNPVADLISVPILNTTNFNTGSYNRPQIMFQLQPVIPFNLSENWMLISRIIQTITWQPYPDQKTGGQFGLGDMAPSFFIAPRNPGSVIWGAGPATVLPTATSSILGQGKLALGPSAVVLAQPGQWTVGGLVSNVWSVAGSGGRPSVNRMTFQYFLAYNLKDDWYLTAAPTIVADWCASAGDRWTVPAGGGVGKLVTFGSRRVGFRCNVLSQCQDSCGMPTWQMNLQVTLLFPKGN